LNEFFENDNIIFVSCFFKESFKQLSKTKEKRPFFILFWGGVYPPPQNKGNLRLGGVYHHHNKGRVTSSKLLS